METNGSTLVHQALEVQCKESEREALLKFKEGFKNHFGYFSSWKAEEDCCQWERVGCNNETGHVIALDLQGDKGAVTLQLQANNLDWLRGLSSLKFLDLGGVDLSKDSHWLEAINMLPSLKELGLFACKLQNLPDSLSYVNFTSLENLLSKFGATSYLENQNLCGPPLSKNCLERESYGAPDCPKMELQERSRSSEEETGNGMGIPPFYISMALGFIIGFWGFWTPLLLNTSWRHAYFKFLGSMIDEIYVRVVVGVAKLQRKLQSQRQGE
ncbi:hypothetical protein GH714_030638 [Hevea brasiliensis]|uniref:Leucine-rich repeat-containing N-terminal plant-type domain-containing protein n=1 Tax=Hevea brasiliensis TaxID=3981 RepID=A0A6A6N8G2_HEVBR|nr:hypothetical protein GH714_030638 [Hevea brasiliensis]